MNKHLNGDQITALMLGTEDVSVSRHLEVCDACGNEVKEMRSAFSAYHDMICTSARRDDGFWEKQTIAINERLRAPRWHPALQWVWVAAMVVVLVTAVTVTRGPRNVQNAAATEEADKVLLQEVQGALAVDVPEALAPAVLIADERNEILASETGWKTGMTQKEGRKFK